MTYTESAAAALEDAHGAVVVTNWDEFGAVDAEFNAIADPVVVDERNIVERRTGINYKRLMW